MIPDTEHLLNYLRVRYVYDFKQGFRHYRVNKAELVGILSGLGVSLSAARYFGSGFSRHLMILGWLKREGGIRKNSRNWLS